MYRNKFDIAEGLLNTPKQVLHIIRNNEKFRNNRCVMELVKLLLDGFRKWRYIALLSGIKSMNPFTSNKDAVEFGYYDYRNTSEFKTVRDILARELGISQAYFRDDIRAKYSIICNMVMDNQSEEFLEKLELTREGFFLHTETNIRYDVFTKEKRKELVKFLEEHPKYEVDINKITIFTDEAGHFVIEVENPFVSEFLEKDYLNRDKSNLEQKQQEVEQTMNEKEKEELEQSMKLKEESIKPVKNKHTMSESDVEVINSGTESEIVNTKEETSNFLYHIDQFSKKVILEKYIGDESYVVLPKEYDGLSVQGIELDAFVDTRAEVLEVDCNFWTSEKLNPIIFTFGGKKLEVVWRNLSKEQEKILKENYAWSEQVQKEEDMYVYIPQSLSQSIPDTYQYDVKELALEKKEEPIKNQQKLKYKNFGMDI